MRLRRVLRWPPLHFALVGGLLFVGEAALRVGEPRAADERLRIEVSDRRVRALIAQHELRAGRSADPATVRVLVDRFVEEEILYREALRHGLASDNPAVVLRLRQKLEFLGEGHGDGMKDEAVLREAAALGLADEDVVLRNMFVRNMRLLLAREADRPPTETELESHLQRHAEDFRMRARVSWRHVVLAVNDRGEAPRTAADALLGRLRSEGLPPERTAELGDPFAGGRVFRGMMRQQIEARFGSELADAVLALPEGRWSDPIASPFGLHLVWVERHVPEQMPSLEEVRDRVALGWRREQREAHLAQALLALRARYDVVVEDGSTMGARSG
ncbi:MAG: peptidyl-prolyl cis-trans isomerase [Deltaproteobacteria bacterium]|nr:peptidyl-prolyl cis-trans isomerase [Deltaproteobacteria bacterium]